MASEAIAPIHPARSRRIDGGVLCAIGVTVPRVKIVPQFSTAVRRTEKLPVLTGGPLSYIETHNFRSRHLIFDPFTLHEHRLKNSRYKTSKQIQVIVRFNILIINIYKNLENFGELSER